MNLESKAGMGVRAAFVVDFGSYRWKPFYEEMYVFGATTNKLSSYMYSPAAVRSSTEEMAGIKTESLAGEASIT